MQPRGEQIATPTDDSVAPDRGLIWQGFSVTSVQNDSVEITLPEGVSLSMHNVYIERIAKGSTDAGQKFKSLPVDSNPNQAWTIGNALGTTIVTTAHGINVFKASPSGLFGGPANLSLLAQATKDENGDALNLYGRFGDQIAFSDDGTQAYISGTGGKVYVFDTQTQTVVYTVQIANSTSPVSSLVVSGGWLYASESGPNGRLVRINVNQSDANFLRELQVVQFGVHAAFGFADMAVNKRSYLAITAPAQRFSIGRTGDKAQGNVYVLQIDKIDKNGKLPEEALLTVDADKFNTFTTPGLGKLPQYVTSGNGNGEFVLSSGKDGTSGVTAFTVGVDFDGNFNQRVTGKAVVLNPSSTDRNWLQAKFQQNIQRSAGNVVVEYEGVEYALVADYNFLFNDSHFVDYEDYGFGKAIGGKIGIIQDPFGKNGGPTYIGATSPIQGGAVDHLTLGADGTLYADVFMDEVSDAGEQMFKSLFVWDAKALIKDALAAKKRGQSLSTPIDRTAGIAGQHPTSQAARYDGANATQEFGWTYGIGSYTVPGRKANLTPTNGSGVGSTAGGESPHANIADNFVTDYWGVSDKAMLDRIENGETKWYNAAAYAAKYTFYTGWNFVTAGNIDRGIGLTEDYIADKLTGQC